MREATSWKISRAGALERLRLCPVRLPPLERGEAHVRVEAVGLNFADVFACLGLYSATPKGEFTPGLEFAGVVEAVGTGPRASDLKVGDRVMGLCRFGGFSSDLRVNPDRLMPLPADWSVEEAAAFPVQTLTAWYALHSLGRVQQGETVLVHSAAGGVGLRALRILENSGAKVVATVGSLHKFVFLQEHLKLAPGQIIVRDRRRFENQLKGALEYLGQSGLDLILDSVTGPYFWPGYRRLNPAGRLVVFGAADFMPSGNRPNYLKLGFRYSRRPRLDVLQMISDNRSVLGFNLIWLWDRLDLLVRGLDQIRPFLDVPPHVGRVFAFEEAPRALRYLQSGESIGKVVLRVS